MSHYKFLLVICLALLTSTIMAQDKNISIKTGMMLSTIDKLEIINYDYAAGFTEEKIISPGLYLGLQKEFKVHKNWRFISGFELSLRQFHDKNQYISVIPMHIKSVMNNNVILSIYSIQLPISFSYYFTKKLSLSAGVVPCVNFGHAKGQIRDTTIVIGWVPPGTTNSAYIEHVNEKFRFLNKFGMEAILSVKYCISKKIGIDLLFEENLIPVFRHKEFDTHQYYGYLYDKGRWVSFGIGVNYVI
jgi:hypothetical protein